MVTPFKDDLSIDWQSEVEIIYSTDADILESKFLNLNSNLARDILGWNPILSQDEAIRNSINWWKSNLLKGIPAEKLCYEEIKNFKLLLSLKNKGHING